MKNTDIRVDQYIMKAEEFAIPILMHLRELVHIAGPEIKETMKWSFPHFEYRGTIVCSMASFKRHCAFGFWNAVSIEDDKHILEMVGKTAMGQLGKISSIQQLPDDEILIAYIIKAMDLIDRGVKAPKQAVAKKPSEVPYKIPSELKKALSTDMVVMEQFKLFSPSKQKDYGLWIEEAKTEATKLKRIAIAIEWIREGKSRNWKYEKK